MYMYIIQQFFLNFLNKNLDQLARLNYVLAVYESSMLLVLQTS